jgi:hypothetical protein
MAEVDPPSPLDRLTANIRRELGAQVALVHLDLASQQIHDLARRIAVEIDYAFDYTFVAKWVRPGEPHHWTEPDPASPTGVSCFRECLRCGRMTKHPTEAEADTDFRSHVERAHLH